MFLLTSQLVKNIKNESQKLLFNLKTPILKLSIIKSNLLNKVDPFVRKQNFFFVSDDIIKICYNKLDYFNQFFSLIQFFFSILPNLNNKNKERYTIVICNSLYILLNINCSNFFQQTTNRNNKIHMFKVKTENRIKKIVIF